MAKLPNYKLDLSKIEILLKQKFEKVQNANEDNFAALTADGNFKDSGKKASSFLANAAKVITKFYLGSDIAGRNLEQDTDGSLKLKENISVSSIVSGSISTNSLNASSLTGIDADDITEGSVNKFYTDTKARAAISSSAAGISYTSSSGVISLTSNYVIPTTTEKANYDSAYANNHTHGNKTNLDLINQSLATTASPAFTGGSIIGTSSAIFSLKSVADNSPVLRLYENNVLKGQVAYRADLDALELRNPQTNGGVVSLPDSGNVTIDGGGTNGQVYISKGNLKIGSTLEGVLKASSGTVGGNATTSDLPDSTDKRYCTDAQKTIINNTSGINTGDENTSSIKTKLGNASSSNDGYLTSADWNTFNGKEPAITKNTAFNKNYETSTSNIKMAGTVSVGTTDSIARADHVHPSDTSKLSLTGGTISGDLNAFSRLQQSVVLQKLKSIVTSPSNIKRVIFFDETGATITLKDRSTNLANATLSANASTLSPSVEGNCRTLNFDGSTYFEFSDSNDLSFNSLGAELITNGSFMTDTIGWSSSNATLESVGSGQSDNCLKITNTAANYGYTYQAFTTVVGQTYRLSFYEQNGTFSAYFRVGTTPNGTQNYPNTGASFGTWGNKTVEFTATATTTYVTFAVNTPVIGSYIYIDEVSIKAVLDSPFSIVALINPNTISSSTILGKNTSYNREWYLSFTSTKRFIAVFYDESTGGNIQTYTDVRNDADVGLWRSYFMTYNGSSNPSGINLYCDGTVLTSIDAAYSGAGGAYFSMESLGASVSNTINGGTKGNSKYGFIAVIAEELSASQVKDIDSLLRSYIGLDTAYL